MAWFRSLLLLVVFSGLFAVTPACELCDRALSDPAANLEKREGALLTLLYSRIPGDVKAVLGWHRKTDILHTLRDTVRYKKWADLFAGTGGFGAACIRQSMNTGVQLDIELNAKHDLTTATGFALFIMECLTLLPGATALIGLPCATFVFLSRGTSLRSDLNGFRGTPDRTDVVLANVIADRIFVLVQVMILRLVEFIIEQPLTSCLFSLRGFRMILKAKPFIKHRRMMVRMTRKFVWLGYFGHIVPKPTVLWGCSRVLGDLFSKRPPTCSRTKSSSRIVRATTTKLVKRGKKMVSVFRIYGVRKALKVTQQYPRRFCDEVASRSRYSFGTL